jgi:hypothetical protein
MEFLNNYLAHVKQTPEQYYHDYNQAVVNNRWDDTTQIREVKEQIVTLNPFAWHDEYRKYEAWVDTVSDLMVQYNKVYSDFLEILPKDIDHPQNYRGQYYKLALDNENEETYLCYDTINNLEQIPSFKVVRCNNVLTMVNSKNEIVKYPCYLGVDISSTNDYVSKSGITPNSRMIVMVQVNDDTKAIVNNQRFMFEHGSTFEVEEINNFMQEEGTNGTVTVMRLYIKYSPLLAKDNKELNLCDYYENTDVPINTEEDNKRIVVSPINVKIMQDDYEDISFKVINDEESEIDQEITYECDWEDEDYYTIESIDGGIRINNIKKSNKPLYITFKSKDCEDVVATVWLVYRF